MLEAKSNKEILKIKTSMLGFTPGQVVSITLGMIAGSITYYVLPVPDFFKLPVVAVVIIFICSFGFVNVDGMNVWQIIRAMISTWRMNRHPLVLRGRREDYNGSDNNNAERPDTGPNEKIEKSGYYTH